MSTEIGQINGIQSPAPQERERVARGRGDRVGTSGDAAPQGPADEVSLSSGALTLLEISERLSAQPDLDHKRVEAIREALSQGSYRIDARRVAEGLIAQERLFLAGGTR
jgi:negative regulator of flagellin synthesis FlgM